MEWARDWVASSDATLWDGVTEYMEEEKIKSHGELCREIIRRIRHAGGEMSRRDIKRSFQNNINYRRDLEDALLSLEESGQLTYNKEGTGGRPSELYTLSTKA